VPAIIHSKSPNFPQVLIAGLFAFATLVSSHEPTRLGAEPPPFFPFPNGGANPQQFFDRMFGAETPEDLQQLKNIEVSSNDELRFGRAAAQAYLDDLRKRNVRVTSVGKDAEYLKQLVDRVRPQMRNHQRYRAIDVQVALSTDTDARCFPGGTIVFHQGLLDFSLSEAALVGVIGHELSHLDNGHQLINIRRMKLAQQTMNNPSAVTPERFFQVGSSWLRAFTRPFQPEDETQADHDGITWAYRLGYDGREMADLFLRLHERDKDKPGMAMPAFLRSHPFHIDRYRALLARHQELSRTEPNGNLYIGRQNLRLRLTRDQRVFNQ